MDRAARVGARRCLAIAARETLRIDLLLTDVVMPGMSGGTLADKLTALRPDLRVLFVSGYSEEDVMGRGGLAPGRAMLEKPFTPSELRRRVRQLLQATAIETPDLRRRSPSGDTLSVMDLLRDVRGCTFDDFLLAPQYSIVDRRDPASLDLSSRLTPRLMLRRPIVSANMDTVTRAEMAVVMAEEGGIGIIDRGFRPGDIEPQVREVLKVKRTQHGVIPDPMTIGPDQTLAQAA
jgi:CheY-like chemotaxis protein